MGLSSFWEILRILRNFHRKSFQRAITQKRLYRKLFLLSYSESSRQNLSNEYLLYGFIFVLRDSTNFAEFSSKIVSKGDNSKTTIPETVFIVIFGILASRPFKRVSTLWVYLYFEIFYIFFKISDIKIDLAKISEEISMATFFPRFLYMSSTYNSQKTLCCN